MAVNIPSSGAVPLLLLLSSAIPPPLPPRFPRFPGLVPNPLLAHTPSLSTRVWPHELTEPLFASRNSNLLCSRDSSASIESRASKRKHSIRRRPRSFPPLLFLFYPRLNFQPTLLRKGVTLVTFLDNLLNLFFFLSFFLLLLFCSLFETRLIFLKSERAMMIYMLFICLI